MPLVEIKSQAGSVPIANLLKEAGLTKSTPARTLCEPKSKAVMILSRATIIKIINSQFTITNEFTMIQLSNGSLKIV